MAMEEVIIIGPSIKDTCWKCQHAMHWALRNNTNCAKYGKKPYEVYFEGAPCPCFVKIDKLPGQPENNQW